jgi:hypothetical protein
MFYPVRFLFVQLDEIDRNFVRYFVLIVVQYWKMNFDRNNQYVPLLMLVDGPMNQVQFLYFLLNSHNLTNQRTNFHIVRKNNSNDSYQRSKNSSISNDNH